jgi:La-related protein 7
MSQQEAVDPPSATDERLGGLPRSGSTSRLNAQAPEFVPRAAAVPPPPPQQKVVRLFAPPPHAAFFVAAPRPPPPPFEYYAAVATGGGGRFGPPAAAAEQEAEAEQPPRDGSFDDPVPKIRKQVGGCSSLSFLVIPDMIDAIRSLDQE